MADNRPLKVFKATNVEAAVWPRSQRETSLARDMEVRVSRSYQDSNGVWRHTNRFFRDDLPRLLLVTEAAYRFLALRELTLGSHGDPDADG